MTSLNRTGIAAAFLLHRLRFQTVVYIIAALAVCWSRVYVGSHYATDVLGGGLVGVIAAILVWRFYREGSRLDLFVTSIL